MVSSKTPAASQREPQTDGKESDCRLLVAAGITLGIGQAGFFDGIVFH